MVTRVRSTSDAEPGLNPVPHTPSADLCLDFVNSRFSDHRGSGTVHDRLPLPEWWSWLIERWELEPMTPPSEVELAGLRRLRSQCRSLLQDGVTPDLRQRKALNRVLGAAPFQWHIESESEQVQLSLRPIYGGVAAVAAAIVVSLIEIMAGDRSRVRVCANPDCSFVFRDTSSRGERRWCDPSICGNLVKVRAFRAARGA